jgi:2-hydroxy-3-keto-5-methylthiopentenyl-1-phosphate phosphatase
MTYGLEKKRVTSGDLKPIIFCDFDGTITEIDATDQILSQLAHPSWREIEQEWVRGTIGSRECLERQMALVTASEAELNALIDSIPVDPTFAAFYGWTRKRRTPLYIVSDGFESVIRRVLGKAGLGGRLAFRGRVFASALQWKDGRLEARFPNADAYCSHGCATCKVAVMKKLAGGAFKIFIGDGLSDRFAAEAADLVYAKGQLLAYCRDHEIKARPFETIAEIQADLEARLPRRHAKRKLTGRRVLVAS